MQVTAHLRDRNCPVCDSRDGSHVAYPARIDEEKLGALAFASRKLVNALSYGAVIPALFWIEPCSPGSRHPHARGASNCQRPRELP